MALGISIPRETDSFEDRLAGMGLGGSDGIEGHEIEALDGVRADGAGSCVLKFSGAE